MFPESNRPAKLAEESGCVWLAVGRRARTHTQTNSICSRAILRGGDAEHRGRSKAEVRERASERETETMREKLVVLTEG